MLTRAALPAPYAQPTPARDLPPPVSADLEHRRKEKRERKAEVEERVNRQRELRRLGLGICPHCHSTEKVIRRLHRQQGALTARPVLSKRTAKFGGGSGGMGSSWGTVSSLIFGLREVPCKYCRPDLYAQYLKDRKRERAERPHPGHEESMRNRGNHGGHEDPEPLQTFWFVTGLSGGKRLDFPIVAIDWGTRVTHERRGKLMRVEVRGFGVAEPALAEAAE
jgi:hypothetical protein